MISTEEQVLYAKKTMLEAITKLVVVATEALQGVIDEHKAEKVRRG